MMIRRIARPLILCAGLAGAATFAPSTAQAQVVVDVEPPGPREEVVPVAPYEGAVWAPGYWNWEGRRHVWVGGHYEHGRPGYAWRRHEWRHEGGHWRMHEGGWERRR